MDIQALFESFRQKKIIVLGDVMLDSYILGNVSRISPEAPVPIVSLRATDERLGGAANVALNLASLGASPVICSLIGDDFEGKRLAGLFAENNMASEGLVKSEGRKTTVKTRIIGNNQQLLRIDSEQTDDISKADEDRLFAKIEALIGSGIDALVFEDYNKGVLTESLITRVIALCREKGVATTVDPKKKNFFAYQGVTLFKPNLKELKEGLDLGFSISDTLAFDAAVESLRTKLKHEITFITLSEHGVFIKNESEKHHIPAHVRNIADVSGAGDTVISVATLCLCAGLPIEQIAAVSNLAGGLVCEKAGVVSIDKEELMEEMKQFIGWNY
ncbi:MAG: PfkB domain protein [Crocinitomicaceae bacterium]|jgi:rfaE bifunctional protein kinase chain/domain|nr:PfkB domain protein [Crocinitomicaceae bacterium]